MRPKYINVKKKKKNQTERSTYNFSKKQIITSGKFKSHFSKILQVYISHTKVSSYIYKKNYNDISIYTRFINQEHKISSLARDSLLPKTCNTKQNKPEDQ